MRCRQLKTWWLAAFVVAATSCKSDSLDPVSGTVASVVITPPTATVAVGASVPLTGEALDASGKKIDGMKLVWASGDAKIAAVSGNGTVTGVAVGTVQIAATAKGKTAIAEVTVNPTPVSSVRLSPTSRDLLVGQTVQITAQTVDAQGNVLAGRPVTFASSNATVASVNASGMVTALAPGSAIITGTSEGKNAVATITVTSVPVASVAVTPGSSDLVVGQTTQIKAEPKDASGQTLAGRVVAWSTSAPNVASVTSSGLVTAIAPGQATITATSEGKTGTVAVTVSPKPVSAVIISPGQAAVTVGQTMQLAAQVTDDQGNVLNGRPISFTSGTPAVATVSSSGLVTGVTPGQATITATSEGKTGTATVTVTPIPVATVEISPSQPNVTVGQTVQLGATAKAASGQTLTDRTVQWGSGAPSVASVSNTGLVTGLSVGTAIVFATIDGVISSATVTVRQVPVASVVVTPPTNNVVVGGTVQLSASVRDASGATLGGRLVGWSSSDETIAVVSSSGLVSALKVGTVTITASSEGKSGTATVTVTAAPVAAVNVTPPTASVVVGQTTTLTAQPVDANGGALAGRAIAWSSSDTKIATVNQSGVVTGVAAGQATITATSEGKSGSATVTVTAVPVASVTVAPPTLSLQTGQTGTLTATVKDASNNVLTDRAVSWSSSNTGVATVSPNGTVTAVGVGQATITATSEGKTGTSAVTVTAPPPAPVATVAVAPPTLSLQVGQTGTLSATTKDAAGNVLTGRTVTWSSSNTGIATVSPNGTVTAVAVGTATITATSEGKTGTAAVTVTAVPVASVDVSPTTVNLTIGGTQQVTATPKDAQGNTLAGRTVTWQSANTGIATVTQAGVITAVGAGSTTVTATSEGKTGTVTVNVAAPAVGSVTISPGSATVNVAFTTQLTATVRDVNNAVMQGASVSWSSSNPQTAAVSQSGAVTGVAPGTATITATSGGKSGTATITVQLAPVATVVVTPSSLNLKAGRTGALTATLTDANGNVLTGRAVSWSSSDTQVATVDQSGVVTAQKKGDATIRATSEGKSDTAAVKVTN